MTSALPFDDIRALLKNLPGADQSANEAVLARLTELGSSAEGLGQMAKLALFLSAWTGRRPAVQRPLVALFAGTHGVARHEVTARPAQAVFQDVEHAAAGGSAISQICGANDLGLKVFDLALDLPSDDFTEQAALDERGCAATMAFGMEAITGGFDLIVLGAMNGASDIAASSVLRALFNGEATDWLDETNAELAGRQAGLIEKAIEFHTVNNLRDPLELLRRIGGRELAALAGAILAARTEKIPVILDGLTAFAAAAILHAHEPEAISHCLFASTTGGAGTTHALECLKVEPLLDLKIAQPGVGGAMAILLARSAAQIFSGIKPLV